ncbi:MAG: AIR synthase-related protein, partial [Flavobacteriales bacterium]
LIFLLGESKNCINASEYAASILGLKNTPAPDFDLDTEYKLQQCIKELIKNVYINAAHDVSNGGLYVTLVEMGLNNNLGFDIVSDSDVRKDAFLFGESQSRVVVTVTEDYEDEFIDAVGAMNVPMTLLGHVTQGKCMVDGDRFGFVDDVRKIYTNTIAEEMN